MAAARSRKPSSIPNFDWKSNNNEKTWSLISALEQKENFVVLFGKQEKSQNTSGESKISVYKRIGAELFPDAFSQDPSSTGTRIKSKADDLVSKYKEYAKRLRTTGEGVVEDDSVDQHLEFYIGPEGPDGTEGEKPANIWNEIIAAFPFFPTLHRFLSVRQNVVPPSITTGVGRQGRQILHLQLDSSTDPFPSDSQIDPILLEHDAQVAHSTQTATPASRVAPQCHSGENDSEISQRTDDSCPRAADIPQRTLTPPPLHSFVSGKENTPPHLPRSNLALVPPKTAPRPPIFPAANSDTPLSAARSGLKKAKKRTFDEELMDTLRENHRLAARREEKRSELELLRAHNEQCALQQKEVEQEMNLYNLGLYTKEEVRERIRKIKAGPKKSRASPEPECASPQQMAMMSPIRVDSSPSKELENGSRLSRDYSGPLDEE